MKRQGLAISLLVVAALYAAACGGSGASPGGDDRRSSITPNGIVAAGYEHTVGLRADGAAVAVGYDEYGRCDVSSWSDVVAVSAGLDHTVGLRADGTAVATGSDENGQCDVSSWSDLVAVSAGGLHTVGLRADGTAVATGDNTHGQCDVSSWSDLVAVSAGGLHTVGLRADGTAVAVGFNQYGRCDVASWKDLVAVSAGGFHTVGLRADGTAVAVGYKKWGRCDVASWKDVVAISAGGLHTVGLRADGTAVAVGSNEVGQRDVSSWKDLVAVSAGYEHTVGLRADGTVVAVGDQTYGQCDTSSWRLAAAPAPGRTAAEPSSVASLSPSSAPSAGPSPEVTVYLLDGSGARECLVSNASWAAQIEKLGGPTVRARDLGSRNQTFLQDAMLTAALPGGKALVLIGLSVGRYTGDPVDGAQGYDPASVLASNDEINHVYSVSQVLSDGRKRGLLDEWLTERYPVFQQTNAASTAELDKLVKECLARKLHPVLLELPLNLDIVGSTLDQPLATYRAGARKIAARHDIPYLDFVADVKLVDGDFYDLMHLVESGRLKWQKRLSVEVVALLRHYGMSGR